MTRQGIEPTGYLIFPVRNLVRDAFKGAQPKDSCMDESNFDGFEGADMLDCERDAIGKSFGLHFSL